MASKKASKSVYTCTSCASEHPRWAGRCASCQEWNTLVESVATPTATRSIHSGARKVVQPLSHFTSSPSYRRWKTGIDDLDFVLGGGIVPGSITLLGGEPGIGKSTILLQVASLLQAKEGLKVLYCSGEESGHQITMRAVRLCPPAIDVEFVDETDLDALRETVMERRPDVLIIDSIQTISTSEASGDPGQVSQVRAVATRIQPLAKGLDMAVFIIGHVTKDGAIAGPKQLEHYVDTVVYFEHVGDGEHRVMRTSKNRFGAANELGVFKMTEQGLEAVGNPSKIFLADRTKGVSGSAVTALLEGSRPVLLEVQALVTKASYGSPQRVTTGFSRSRLALLLAILEKRAGYRMSEQDVFLNVVGGLEISDPAADAAVLAAIASSAVDRPLPGNAVFLGEAGLGGELRRVRQADRRLAESFKLGFSDGYLPNAAGTKFPAGMRIHAPVNLSALLNEVLGPPPVSKKKKNVPEEDE